MKLKAYRVLSNVVIISMLIFMCVFIGASNYQYVFNYNNENVIYNGNRDNNKVSLMFNIYWGTEYIDGILDTLDQFDVKTTVFVGGQWVEKEPEMHNKIISRGHEIGNHGYFHKEHEHLSYEQNFEEINTTHNLVNVVHDYEMSLFAPPSGSFNRSTLNACAELGYSTIMWSKDTIDWRDKDANLIFTRATSNVKGGDLILAHPTENTLKALPLILEYYRVNNLVATTVSDCLK